MQDQIYNDGLPVQASITDLIERDHDESRSATVRTFLVRESPQHEWKHARTRIDIGRADRVACDPFRWMYQTALVARLSLNIDQFLSTLAELVGKQQLRLPDLPIVALQGRSWWYEYLPSNNATFNLHWPAHCYRIRQESSVPLPSGPFLAAAHPMFSDAYALIREHLDYHFSPGGAGEGGLDLLLSNARVRIESVTIGHDRLAVTLDPPYPSVRSPLGKIHITEQASDLALHADLRFDAKPQSVQLGFSPGDVLICLVSQETEELLDFRRFRLTEVGLATAATGVHVELPSEEELRALILQGENDQVEFKSTLKDTEDVAETLVGFSNTKGGLVIVGVDNRGQMAGFSAADAENTVQNIVRSFCDPVIAVRVEHGASDGIPLLLIRVPEGPDKPYTLRDRGVIVRAGSTDRVATRYELDAIYDEKRRPGDLFGS